MTQNESDDPRNRSDLTPQPHGGALRGPWTPEEARAAAQKRAAMMKEGSDQARRLLKDEGIEWDEADEITRGLAQNAVRGKSSDWRLLLQHLGKLRPASEKWNGQGPCPTCGQTPGQGLTITAETIEQLHRARSLLKELLEEDVSEKPVSMLGTLRGRGSGRTDPGGERRPAPSTPDGGQPIP